MDDEITIRLKGGDEVKPGLIKSKELADIMAAIEEMVVAEALRHNKELLKEDIVVGLYRIEDKSIGLKFKTGFASIVIPAFILCTESINSGNFESLSHQSIKSLKTISSFSKRHNCDAILGANNTQELARITPSTEVPESIYISGATELVGKVIRVGGKVPKAMLELTDGSIIYCEVPEEIAIDLGHMLYSLATFSGFAKWESGTLELEEFSITEVTKLGELSPYQSLQKISSLVGSSFNGVKNMNSFVSSLRSGAELQ